MIQDLEKFRIAVEKLKLNATFTLNYTNETEMSEALFNTINWITGEDNGTAITTKTNNFYGDVTFTQGDYLLFGSETSGLPEDVRAKIPDEDKIRIPMLKESRSMNLSNATAVIVYDAWRQLGFPNAV